MINFLFGCSVFLNIGLIVFAMWQHNIIKEAAKELGIKL